MDNETKKIIETNEKAVEILADTSEKLDKLIDDKPANKRKYSDRKYTVQNMIDMKIPFSDVFIMKGIKFGFDWMQVLQIMNNRLVEGDKVTVNSTLGEILAGFSDVAGKSFL